MRMKRDICVKVLLMVLGIMLLGSGSLLGMENNEEDNIQIINRSDIPGNYQHQLTLITGDVLFLNRQGDNRWQAIIKPAERPYGKAAFKWHTDQNNNYFMIPVDVIPLLNHRLDPTFFNITYLIENEMDDDHMPFISTIAWGADDEALTIKARSKGYSTQELSTINAMTLNSPKNQLKKRNSSFFKFDRNEVSFALKGIDRLILDRKVYLKLDKVIPAVGADIVQQQLGFDGTGVNIAILDTGIDSDHPDFFFSNGSSKIAVNYDGTCFATTNPMICDNTPLDLNSHGTHVSGIAAGTGSALLGEYKGMAPGANLLNIKVLGQHGFGMVSNIIHGIDVALLGTNSIRGDEPDIEADVISMSLGGSPQKDDPMVMAVNKAISHYNVPVVVAAGNFGPRSFSIDSPGVSKKVITVGAGSKSSPFTITAFSGRGPTAHTFLLKPDIIAPGEKIISACSSKPIRPNCLSEFPYFSASGTSMATPVVAGAVALLIQQGRENNQSVSADRLKDILLSSSQLLMKNSTEHLPISSYEQGAGFLRVDQALTSDLLFSPANVQFGKISVTMQNLSKTILLENRGPAAKEFLLSATLNDVAILPYSPSEGNIYDHAVTITPSKVILSPGERVNLNIDIDLSQLPIPDSIKAYNGYVHAIDTSGKKVHGTLGFVREGNLYDLKITGLNSIGGPASSTPIEIFNPKSGKGYRTYTILDPKGEATARLPEGLYNIFMQTFEFMPNPNGGMDFHTNRVSHLEVPVGTTPVEVLLDARKTKPIGIQFSADPLAIDTVQQVAAYSFKTPDGAIFLSGIGMTEGEFDRLGVYCDKPATIGMMEVYNYWQKARSPHAESKVIYNVADIRQKEEPFQLVIDKKNLTKYGINIANYYTEKGQVAGYANRFTFFGKALILPSPMAVFSELKTPIQRHEYITPNMIGSNAAIRPYIGDQFMYLSGDTTKINGKIYVGKRFLPGEKRYEKWLQRPYTPALTSVMREKEALIFEGSAFMDPMGRVGSMANLQDFNFFVSVRVNGKLKGYQDHFLRPLTVFLPPTPQQIEVQLKSKANPLSSDPRLEAETDFTFMSDASTLGSINIPKTRYRVKKLNLQNEIPSKGNLEFDIILTGMKKKKPVMLKFIELLLSIDDGQSWFPPNNLEMEANSIRVEANIPMSAHGKTITSVKLNIETIKGLKMEEIIKRAFIMVPKAN